ncbi:hypothetical protein ACS0TY_026968 [Phlomoides rotata]
MRVWVKVDGKEFNLHHAAQQILKSTMHMSCSIDGLNELDEMVRESLQWWRCLIVFDGVESMTLDLWLHMKKYWFNFVYVGSKLPPYVIWPLYQYISFDSSDAVERMWHAITRNLKAFYECNPLLLKLVGSMMGCHDSCHFAVYLVPSSSIKAMPSLCTIFPKDDALDRVKIINMWPLMLLCGSFFTDIARNEYGDITVFRLPGLIHSILRDVSSIVWKGKVGVICSITEDAHQLSLHLEGPEDMTTLISSSTLYYGGSSSLDFPELQSLDLSCSGIQNLSDDTCALTELRFPLPGDCGCKELPSLGRLPFLKEMQLNRMMNLECIDQEFYGAGVSDVFFPSLEQLELYDLPWLLKWTGSRFSMLSDCSGVTALYAFSNSVFRSLKTDS